MGDDDQRLARGFDLEALDQGILGLRVHRAGRLVEHQDRWVAGERAIAGIDLPLSARELLAAVGQAAVVAVGDLPHELVRPGNLCHTDQFGIVDRLIG